LSKVAIVELEPGVEGYIPLREIREATPQRIDEVIWIGDTVEAVITNLKQRKRRVVVSMRKHLLQLAGRNVTQKRRRYMTNSERMGSAMIDLIKAEDRLALLNLSKAQHNRNAAHDSPPQFVAHLERILIADDDPSFRLSLQSLLARLGHTVTSVEYAEDAVSICSDHEFDLVLIDLKRVSPRRALLDTVGVWGSNPHAPTNPFNNLAVSTAFSVQISYAD